MYAKEYTVITIKIVDHKVQSEEQDYLQKKNSKSYTSKMWKHFRFKASDSEKKFIWLFYVKSEWNCSPVIRHLLNLRVTLYSRSIMTTFRVFKSNSCEDTKSMHFVHCVTQSWNIVESLPIFSHIFKGQHPLIYAKSEIVLL